MDKIKSVVLEAVQKTLGHRATLNEIENAIIDHYGPGAATIEHNDLSASETMIVVRGGGGPSRHFRVKVSEVI